MQYEANKDQAQLKAIRSELAMLQARRILRTLAVIQDIADALLTLPDLGSELLNPCNLFYFPVRPAYGRASQPQLHFTTVLQKSLLPTIVPALMCCRWIICARQKQSSACSCWPRLSCHFDSQKLAILARLGKEGERVKDLALPATAVWHIFHFTHHCLSVYYTFEPPTFFPQE